MDKISSAIALRQVDLSTKMESVKKFLDKILSLYRKLHNVDIFTKENQQSIEQLQGDLQLIGTTLRQSPNTSQVNFKRLLLTQSRLAEFQAKDANIQSNFINIQSMLAPHMDFLQKELAFVETLMKKYSHLSTQEGLVDMEENLEIHIQSLDVANNNWDSTSWES